jgi:membrane protease subunit HflK
MRDVPEESLMLTGDENIVDVDFTVLWRIKPKGVGRLSVQHPESRRHREGGRRKRDA